MNKRLPRRAAGAGLLQFFGAASLLALSGQSATAAVRPRVLRQAFGYTVQAGDSAGRAYAGVLTLQINPKDGRFTGTLTPGIVEGTTNRLPSVVLDLNDGTVQPVGTVTSIAVRGSLQGHALHLVLLDAGGSGKHVYCTASAEVYAGKYGTVDPVSTGGTAVGPEPGDIGTTISKITIRICFRNFWITIIIDL
jgi:hypothetical protein